MKRLGLITCLIMVGTTGIRAQSPDDYRKNEYFAGYSYHSADINTLTIDPERTGQHGVNLAYTRRLNRHVGLTLDTSAHFMRDTRTLNGSPFNRKRDQYYFLGGVEYRATNEGSVTPFARALVGASLFRGFTSNVRPTGTVFTFDDATSFALAIGGGLDVRLNDRLSVRVIQADYTPTFFGPGRQNNLRLSFGIVFK